MTDYKALCQELDYALVALFDNASLFNRDTDACWVYLKKEVVKVHQKAQEALKDS